LDELYYHKEKGECDFLLRSGNKIVKAIQVTEYLDEHNREREINGLVEALEKFNLKSGLILTVDEEDEFQKNGKKIKVLPVWKWLLK
jgi:predicted AAA+ superfamily ATPase